MTNDLNYRDKTKNDIIKELQKLQQEHDSLKTSYEKDITERLKIEKELRNSEERWRKLVTTSPDYIALHDLKGTYRFLNHYAKGYSEKDVIGKPFIDFIADKSKGLFSKTFNKCLKTKRTQQFEYTALGENGKLSVYEGYLVPIIEYGKAVNIMSIAKEITRRKQTEEALHLEKENFRNSLDDSPIGVRIATVKGNTIYANKAILNFYGYDSLEELQKTPLKDRYTPESYGQAQKRKHQRELGNLSAIDYEISIVRKNGEIRHLQVFRKKVLWNGDWQFQVIYNDITDRKQAEQALRNNEENMRYIVKHDPNAIAMYDRKLHYIAVSDRYLQDYNLKEKDIIGKHHYEVFPEMPQKWKDVHQRCLSGAIERNDDDYFERPDGSITYNRWECRPWYRFDGEIGGIITYTEVTTERKLAEETIRILARFSSENPDPVLRVNRNGQLLYANEASYKLLTWKLQIGKKTPLVLQKIIAEAMKEGIGKKIDTKHKQRIITFNVVPVVEAGYANFYGQDITLRNLAEEEIKKSKKSLEDLHNHLDEILENERALISREIHDQIGQSLTALKLDLNWMHKYINNLPEAVAKLGGMIDLVSDTIKDVQRISSDLRPGILDDLGLATAIEWYTGEFEKRTGIKCNLMVDDSIFGNSKKNLVFFRVLQEALTNVIRHANASSVTIKLHQILKGTTLTIQDNGIGIYPGKIESGKALGLIGMRERVRQFGGRVDISTGKGQGTKLTVFIPEKKTSV